MTLRFKFKKYGTVVYLGHLDVMRFFQKAIRRSGIDAQYTEGYSPHLKLSFAQPLSVGVETDGDYFDLVMNSLPDMNTIKDEMNKQCVEGFEIVSVTLLNDDADNAMSSVKAAEYLYTFKEDLDEKVINDFFSKESYEFEFTIKNKTKVRDVMPDIYSYSFEGKEMRVSVNASSSGNLNANVIILALQNIGYENECLCYKRLDLYTQDSEGNFVSLEQQGKVFN